MSRRRVRRSAPQRRVARLLMLWLMVAVLPVMSTAGLVTQLFGPMHVHSRAHAQPSPAMRPALAATSPARATWLWRGLQSAFEYIQDAQVRAHAQAHALGLEHHDHPHVGTERHWHALSDASVVSLGGDGGGADAPSVAAQGGAAFLLAFGEPAALSFAAPQRGPWPGAGASRWHDAVLAHPERPPRP